MESSICLIHSAAASAGTILKHLGSVKHAGVAVTLNAPRFAKRQFGWDKTFGAAHGHTYVTGGLDRAAAEWRAPEVQAAKRPR